MSPIEHLASGAQLVARLAPATLPAHTPQTREAWADPPRPTPSRLLSRADWTANAGAQVATVLRAAASASMRASTASSDAYSASRIAEYAKSIAQTA